jgi:hypothetical protein
MFELLYLFVIVMSLYFQEKYASTAHANDKLEEADYPAPVLFVQYWAATFHGKLCA